MADVGYKFPSQRINLAQFRSGVIQGLRKLGYLSVAEPSKADVVIPFASRLALSFILMMGVVMLREMIVANNTASPKSITEDEHQKQIQSPRRRGDRGDDRIQQKSIFRLLSGELWRRQ